VTEAGGSEAAVKPTVFISYARTDRPRVKPLADALTAAGYEVWWDVLIEGGAAFARTIAERLQAADAVIVVWSAASVVSDWVRDEADHARQRGRLAPVLLDGTPPPLGFGQYHAVDLSTWHGNAGAPEIDSVIAAVADVSGAPAPQRRIAKRGGVSRRTALLGGGTAVAATAVGALVVFKPFAAVADANSVAVLPFANLSGDPAQAYFSDGLAEEVRSALARNGGLKVAARTSSNLFRDLKDDAKGVAKKLDVAFLLEGSVRKGGDMVRVAAELIDAKTGFSSWSQTFDRPAANVLNVQTEIADTVARALAVKVDPASKAKGSTNDPAAYDAYLRAKALYNADAGEASDRAALAQIDAAVARDGNYAAALALKARIQALIADQYAVPGGLRAAYDAAIATAQRAAAIAPDLADTEIALGNTLFNGRIDVKGARAPYEHAAQLGAGDADVLIPCAFYFAMTKRVADAQRAATKARELDPLNPRAWRMVGTVDYARRDYPSAIGNYDHAIRLAPNLGFARAIKANALLLTGRAAEARDICAGEPIDLFRLTGLAIIEQKLGRTAEAQAARADLIERLGDNSLYQQAEIAAQWGKTDLAIAALLGAQKASDTGLIYAATDPLLDPIRNRPEFSALLKSLGFD
jgi:TolB-like protein